METIRYISFDPIFNNTLTGIIFILTEINKQNTSHGAFYTIDFCRIFMKNKVYQEK